MQRTLGVSGGQVNGSLYFLSLQRSWAVLGCIFTTSSSLAETTSAVKTWLACFYNWISECLKCQAIFVM